MHASCVNRCCTFFRLIYFLFSYLLQDWFYRVFGRPEQKLQGELALVTGGGGGLGRLLSLRLSKLGVDIVIWDINQEGILNLYNGISSNAKNTSVRYVRICNKKKLRIFH